MNFFQDPLFFLNQGHSKDPEFLKNAKRMVEEAIHGQWDLIPLLHQNSFNKFFDGQLVRYVGMVQETWDPEMYLEQFEGMSSKGMFRGFLKYKEEFSEYQPFELSPHNQTIGQRLPIFCVPIPGQQTWSFDLFHENNTPITNSSNSITNSITKTFISSDSTILITTNTTTLITTDTSTLISSDTTEESNFSLKRSEPDPFEMEIEEQSSTKKPFSQSENQPFVTEKQKTANKFHPAGGQPCIVLVYDDEGESFKVNQMVEWVGLFYSSPRAFEDDETSLRNVSASVVPRIHVLTWRVLNQLDLVMPQSQVPRALQWLEQPEALKHIRGQLVSQLACCVGGDAVMAEYVLLWMISTVFDRPLAHSLCLGKLSLNLTGDSLQNGAMEMLQKAFESLLPLVCSLDLSISTLNDSTFLPRKDHQENRLNTGLLQLGDHTHLLVNEFALDSGKLIEKGLQNLSALSKLISVQSVDYDFEFYQHAFPADVPVLVFSCGKSLLPCDVVIPHQPTEIFNDFSNSLLEDFRVWLALVRHFIKHTRVHSMQPDPQQTKKLEEMVTTKFVLARKQDESLNSNTLNFWVNLANLVSFSFFEPCLSESGWIYAMNLENERKKRINKN